MSTMKACQLASVSLLLVSLFVFAAFGQDSTVVSSSRGLESFGLQASWVSGIGLTYGQSIERKFRARATAGVIKSEGETFFSVGCDLHYELSNRPDLHVFIGPSMGTSGGSARLPRPRLAFATGLESPLFGDDLYENISGGILLYYPTYFILSQTVGFAVGAFLVYNF